MSHHDPPDRTTAAHPTATTPPAPLAPRPPAVPPAIHPLRRSHRPAGLACALHRTAHVPWPRSWLLPRRSLLSATERHRLARRLALDRGFGTAAAVRPVLSHALPITLPLPNAMGAQRAAILALMSAAPPYGRRGFMRALSVHGVGAACAHRERSARRAACRSTGVRQEWRTAGRRAQAAQVLCKSVLWAMRRPCVWDRASGSQRVASCAPEKLWRCSEATANAG